MEWFLDFTNYEVFDYNLQNRQTTNKYGNLLLSQLKIIHDSKFE